jgi:hypothetical protein
MRFIHRRRLEFAGGVVCSAMHRPNRPPFPHLVFNGTMRRVLVPIAAVLGLALALPTGALAKLTELGDLSVATNPVTTPSCPGNPCLAVSRTTGYQAKSPTTLHPFSVPRDGKIVAWSISLGKPTAKQIAFFNANEGGAASAGIATLRPGPVLKYTLISQSPLVALQPYFGMTAQFPLDRTLTVKKGDVVALTVPTWAPALALGFNNSTSWRASRGRKACNDTTTQTAHTAVGSVIQYFCLYKTARLTYGATLISTP